jgi:aspartate carbamoyltransferase catalytic subunit
MKNPWRHTHLLGMEGLTAPEIQTVLHHSLSFKEVSSRRIKKVPTLRGRTVIHLFLEPSTRTRTSFEIAAKRLSADIINITGGASSLVKGETLVDTAKNLQAMNPDVIVIRHGSSGAPEMISRLVDCCVINAGDGSHEHPTQALVDAMTIQEKKGRIAGLKVVIVGDILHSRVARSNIYALTTLGADVHVCGPGSMIPKGVERLGVKIHLNLEKALEGADVVMLLRIQLERESGMLIPNNREYARQFGLNPKKLARAKPDAIIMHPGPITRGVAISHELADAALYLVTSAFGVHHANETDGGLQ